MNAHATPTTNAIAAATKPSWIETVGRAEHDDREAGGGVAGEPAVNPEHAGRIIICE